MLAKSSLLKFGYFTKKVGMESGGDGGGGPAAGNVVAAAPGDSAVAGGGGAVETIPPAESPGAVEVVDSSPRVPGPIVPGVDGLELFQRVVPEELEARAIAEVDRLLALGEAGELVGKTYAPITNPRFRERSQSRKMLQFGVSQAGCNELERPPTRARSQARRLATFAVMLP